LQAHGLNHTRTFAGTYREIPGSFKMIDNTTFFRHGSKQGNTFGYGY
jgi:hypothetical protein